MALAKGLTIYANGIDLAGAFKSFNFDTDVESLDATTLGNTSKAYQLGFRNGKASASGVWDWDGTTMNKIDNILRAAFANQTDLALTASLETLAASGVAVLIDGKTMKYGADTPLGQLIMANADFQANNGIGFGKWLYSSTLNNTSANSSSIDNTTSSATGAACHAHLQNTSATIASCSVKWQHSILGSVWVDLTSAVNFTVNATNYGYITTSVAAGTTIYRYVRAVVTTSGGSAAVQVAFARK